MVEVRISTPRGVTLAGTFEPGPGSAAVLFVHGFLADRRSAGVFDVLAERYREAGYATLQLDLSGCGASEDDVITVAGEVEDLRSASDWLTEQGYPVQALHAHAFGALAALRAQPPAVVTMVLTDPVTGPMHYPWEEIFAPGQLEELDTHGFTRIPDDNDGAREYTVISKTTLADYSLIDQAELLGGLRVPVLVVHSYGDDGATELVDLSREGLPLLPAGSRLEVLEAADRPGQDRVDAVAELALAWLAAHLPA
ncbi:alpha/beta fold hydrolase [Georgenia sp. TF02-10]|uniref:alpha/beta hydrolase n=1 Tax=Georgenia sp. TF02-10 TaxID=2917725 RepID=UPI001FA6E8E8|nr:alpha/beta fold hydrolase [Georgenia sp. TF02-10]UNX55053.1 alpha/beta fold hydrolase [Georgenia sp. TF02-10]